MNSCKALLVIILISVFSGCSTTENFTVYAPQNAKIFTPNNPTTPQGITGNDGKVNLIVPSETYCGYILAQFPESDMKIPIGLDFKSNNHTGTKAAFSTGAALTCAGFAAMVTGCMLVVATGDDDTNLKNGGIAVEGGAVAMALGSAMGYPAYKRMKQTAYDYNFGYVNKQRIAVPQLSYTLLNPNPPKGSKEETTDKKTSTRKKATSGKEVSPKTTSTKVNTARSDNAKKVEGTYTGNGTLYLGKNIEEEYSDISLIMERVDKNHVSVRIIENDEDYFDTPLVYEVSKDKKGGYTLKINNLPEATIQITSKGKLTFNHKKVNIDDTLYILKIIADKE